MEKRDKVLTLNCTEEQFKKLKQMAKDANLTQSNYMLCKLFDLKPVIKDEIIEYKNKVGEKDYIQRRVSRKIEFVPIEQDVPASPVPEEVTT